VLKKILGCSAFNNKNYTSSASLKYITLIMHQQPPPNIDLRHRLKTQRRQLSEQQIGETAASVNRQLWKLPELARGNRIGCYLSVNGEVNCDEFIRSAWMRKKRIFVPILRKSGMGFFQLNDDDSLQNNRFGIPEPLPKTSAYLSAKNLDIILLPLLGFDSKGNRLGMGGGYYDRLLAFTTARSRFRRPLLIGLGYDFQRAEALKKNNWDIPMHLIVTQGKTYRF